MPTNYLQYGNGQLFDPTKFDWTRGVDAIKDVYKRGNRRPVYQQDVQGLESFVQEQGLGEQFQSFGEGLGGFNEGDPQKRLKQQLGFFQSGDVFTETSLSPAQRAGITEGFGFSDIEEPLITSEDSEGFNAFLRENYTKYPGMSTLDPTGQFATDVDPDLATQAIQDYRTYEADQFRISESLLTQDEANLIITTRAPGVDKPLDKIYGEDNLWKAQDDLESWLDEGEVEGGPSRREAFQLKYERMGVLQPGEDIFALDADGRLTIRSDIDQEMVYDIMGEFAMAAQEGTLASFQEGVGAGDTGDDTGDDLIPPLDPNSETFLADVQSTLDKVLGTGLTQDVIEVFAGGMRNEEELVAAFEKIFAPAQADEYLYGKPEATARGTQAAGGMGSGVGASTFRAAATFAGTKNAAQQSYIDAGLDRNLKLAQGAIEMAKTPGQIANLWAEVGVKTSTTQVLMEQARSAAYDTDVTQPYTNWMNLGLTEATYEQIIANTAATEMQTLWQGYQLAVAEAGYDANILAQNQEWYMNGQLGSFSNPLLAFIAGLTDIQTYSAFAQPGEKGMFFDFLNAGATVGAGMAAGGGKPGKKE